MPETLTNAQCDEFRRLPVSFNDMLRAVHAHGQGLGGPPPGAADRMLHATLSTLGAIDHALGIGADGCGDPEQTLEAIAALQAQKDGAYLERNRCVALLARMALAMGLRAGLAKTAIEGWSPDWHGCVYIDLPTGQASWHYHDSQAELFAGLPEYAAPWDGHDTPTKYERLAAAFPVPAIRPDEASTWYSADDETFNCEGLGELLDQLEEPSEGQTYYAAEFRRLRAAAFLPRIDNMLEDCDAQLFDDVGEHADELFSDAQAEAREELRQYFRAWIERHVNVGKFSSIVGRSRELQLTADDLAISPCAVP